ncbi:hypothetical protein ABC255_02190 [Neobacillus sp. 3P2-tot-E-2]|uniref:hypothetical protein n=1 Tax=Neobacillus sp. 3P2-tot-E-2 TaxID=3132212 RepID=UPI0039A38604
MKTKKIILFIVEGISDQTTLGLILSKLIKTENVMFHLVNGDITTDKFTTVANVNIKVNDQIKSFLSRYHFKKSDLLKVIHLIDTDGAFVRENYIQEDDVDGFIYSPAFIKARKVESVLQRNQKKSAILNKLCTCSKVSDIPYSMYYFSCNLEHVLHNECNMDDSKKDEVASEFTDKFFGIEEEFVEFIRNDEFAVPGDYKETWDFIKRDNHSLKRHCNFHLFFD